MSGRIGFGSSTHAFVTYVVLVSIVIANRYRPGAEEGRILGKRGQPNLPHWAPRMTLIVILCAVEIGCRGCRRCSVVAEENKKTICDKILVDASSKVSDFRLRARPLIILEEVYEY